MPPVSLDSAGGRIDFQSVDRDGGWGDIYMQWKRNPDSTQGDVTPPMAVGLKANLPFINTHTYIDTG